MVMKKVVIVENNHTLFSQAENHEGKFSIDNLLFVNKT